MFAGAVRSKDDADAWVPVDADVEKRGGRFEPKAAAFEVGFSDGGDKTAVSVVAPGETELSVGWPSTLPAPRVDGDTLTYADAAPATDLVVSSREDGFSYSMLLRERPALDAPQVEYRVPLDFGDASVKVDPDGSIVVRDGKRRVAMMSAPVMWDGAAGNVGGSGERLPVAAAVEGAGGVRTLVLRPDMGFLKDPATVFPVTVDPTVVIDASYDTWVQSTGDTSSRLASPELRVGSSDGGVTIARSYLYFDTSSVAPGAVPVSASIGLTNFASGSCPGTGLRMSPLASAWDYVSGSWASQPSTTATASSLSSQAFGPGCGMSSGVVSFDAKELVGAYLAYAPNFGVQIRAEDETAASGFRRFYSNETGVASAAPKFTLTYNNPPSTPGATQVVPAVQEGSVLFTSSATPALSAVMTDPDGAPVTANVRIMQGATVVTSTSVGPVASGASATYVASTPLADGTYSVQWQAGDGALTSGWSPAQSFVVDTTAPGAPGIGCTGVAYATWYASAPASTSCYIEVSAGTKAVSATLNGEPIDVTWNGAAPGNAYVYPSIPAGYFNLTATLTDSAVNGVSNSFEFGYGQGATTKPANGMRASRQVIAAGAARAGASDVVPQWTLAGANSWQSATKVKKNGVAFNNKPVVHGGMSVTGDLEWFMADEPGAKNPSLVEIRFCFLYPTTPGTCTTPSTVNLVPHAFGGSFPTGALGPATVSLHSGEFQLDATDVSVPGFGQDLSISRTYQSFGTASTAQSVFGPGWRANMDGPDSGMGSARVVDETASNGTISLVDIDGSTATYRISTNGTGPQAPGVYVGQGEAATFNQKLQLIAGAPKTLVLTEADNTTTTWQYAGGTSGWTVKEIKTPTGAPATTYSYDGAYVSGIYAGIPGVVCSETTQAKGCHALLMNYTSVAGQQRLIRVDLRTWDPAAVGGAAMATIPVAVYTYDTAGLLTGVYDPREAVDAGANLITSYGYQSQAGRTFLASVKPPGEKAWNFTLDTSERLSTVTRAQDEAVGGTATWRVDYSVPLSGTGLPNLTPTAVKRWTQPEAPARGAAVFGPDAPAGSDYTYADLTYFTADAEVTNTATYGGGQWQIDSVAYDQFGNVTWSLDAGALRAGLENNWNRFALGFMLSTRTFYDTSGKRVEFILGPTRWLQRDDGAMMMARPRTDYVYDDEAAAAGIATPGRPAPSSDPTTPRRDLVVEQRTSISTWDGEPVHAGDEQVYDLRKTRYRYDKVLASDGDGWVLQTPTRVMTQLGAGWSTTLTRFDTYGQVLETRTPQGVAALDGAGSDAYSTLTDYFTADGSSGFAECRDRPELVGMVCRTRPGVSNGHTPTTVVKEADYLQNPTKVEETSAGMTRTTTSTFDKAGRLTESTVAMTGAPGGDLPLPTKTITYNPTTGAVASTSSTAGTVAFTYDTWGRVLTQTDGSGAPGGVMTSTYDAAGRVKTMDDGKGTYTYTYDGTDADGRQERRGMVTKLDVGLPAGAGASSGGGDEFKAAYDSFGNATTVLYPGGITKRTTVDTGNRIQAIAYARNGTSIYSETTYRDVDGDQRWNYALGGIKNYTYDGRDRLIKVEDNAYWTTGCTTRTYGFSLDSNRTSLATAAPVNGACSSANPVTTTRSYASDSRITDPGYSYDAFGRTRTVPATDTTNPGASAVSTAFYANDMIARLTQTVGGVEQTKAYTLDTTGRVARTTFASGAAELRRTVNHYTGDDDSPSWTEDQTRPNATAVWSTGWTRNVAGIEGDLALIQKSDGTSRIQLANLHGDIVTTLENNTSTSTALENYSDSTEYGAPASGFAPYALKSDYGWLGAKQRSGDTIGGLILMGARVYNPATGLFLSRDPVPGGNDNTYTYPADPINDFDLNGQWSFKGALKKVGKIARSARKNWKSVLSYASVGVCIAATVGACLGIAAATASVSFFDNLAAAKSGKKSAQKAAGSFIYDAIGVRIRSVRASFTTAHRLGKQVTRSRSLRSSFKLSKARTAGRLAYNVGSAVKTAVGW